MLGAKILFRQGINGSSKANEAKAKTLTPYQQRELDILQAKYDGNQNPSNMAGRTDELDADPFKGLGGDMYEFVKNQIIASLSRQEKEQYEQEQQQLKALALQIDKSAEAVDSEKLIAAIPAPDNSMVELVHAKIRAVGENISRSLNLDPRYPYRF